MFLFFLQKNDFGFCFSARLYFIRLGKRGNELLVFALAGTRLLSMGSLTALCSRDPWEMLYIHVALQRFALARWQERERQRMSVYESLSHAPFPCAEELSVSYRSS